MNDAPGRPSASKDATPTSWHALTAEQALRALGADRNGLSHQEAERRLAEAGPNRLPAAKPRSALWRFLAQFNNVLIYVLLASAAITLALGHATDAAVVLAVVVANAVIGFIQEGRAERALDAIKSMLAPRASAVRSGRRLTVDAERLVPGDLVMLEAGDRVPADLRLLRSGSLRMEEAALTGESVPVDKSPEAVPGEAPLGDRASMAFSGTMVASGSATGLVVATGAATEIGRISGLVQGVGTLTTPLLRQMNIFARLLTVVILGVSAAVFGFAVLVRAYPIDEAFLAMIGIAVAAIPEGLPAVLTITLAIGVRRMAARNAIIRRLPAVETLGSVSVICTDKTGTLTRNEMMVAAVATSDGTAEVTGTGHDPNGTIGDGGALLSADRRATVAELAQAALLCNDAALHRTEASWRIEGDPMEGALIVFAAKAGLEPDAVRNRFPRLHEIPFDARHRFMATLHRTQDGAGLLCMKGAPERILEMCHRERGPAGDAALDRDEWHRRVEALAAGGQRVIAFASRPMPGEARTIRDADAREGMTLLGLVGLIDPPRAEAASAVRECRAAGIRVKMITGDHAATARAIGRQLGLENSDSVATGHDLDRLDDDALRRVVAETDVFARTSPEHKLRLVAALQADGAVIAMTGDGVNDAPALKRADVGVAMGRKGTEAAKEAAQMVLADDNFASIVAAVREGRTVYDNLKKVIAWTLPTDGGEALTVIAAILAGLTLPITPVQILWINTVTAVGLGLTLAFEPPEPNVMRRPPRTASEPLLSVALGWQILFVSLLFLVGAFGIFYWAEHRGLSLEAARTMVVNAIVAMEIFYLFSVRYRHGTSLTWTGVMGTPAVLIGIAAVFALQLIFTYVPLFQRLFETRAIGWWDGLAAAGVGAALLLVAEIEKFIRRMLVGGAPA
jgi:magnesium-transporting ATPase (P-type)